MAQEMATDTSGSKDACVSQTNQGNGPTVAKLMGKMVRIVDPSGSESFAWPLNVDDAETQALAREQATRQENADLRVRVSKLELGIQTLIESLKE